MKLLKIPNVLCAVVSLSVAQSPYNSISHGVVFDHLDASSVSQGSIGLVPSHNSSVSVVNPATWVDLKFTLLTAHYSTGEVEYPMRDFKSQFGRLAYAAFIVPIKKQSAFGLGLRPFSRKQFSLTDDSMDTVFFSGDTVTFKKNLVGNGGISSFFTAGSWRINQRNSLGVRLDFLLGVFDEETETTTSGSATPSRYRRHFEYKGTLVSLFLRSSFLEPTLRSTVHAGLQFPVGSPEIIETDYFMHISPKTKPVHTFSLPTAIVGGLVYHVSKNTHISVEASGQRFTEELNPVLNTLDGGEGDDSRVSLGLLRERVTDSPALMDRFHYRIGFFQRQHYISRRGDDETLQEKGITLGLGIPFGFTQNQIDIGFRFSSRTGFLSNESELERQVTVGLTIGDVWLVKRKRR